MQDVAPKVFDLLLMLLDRRHRIVSKDELQATLCPGPPVSDSAIARTVMQARRAVGDPALIKTIHGVGYRFVGECSVPEATTLETVATTRLRMGVLPATNRTGQTQYEWAELGLPAMVIQALDNDAHLSVLSLPEMLTALTPSPASASVAERAEAASRLLGLQGCVHAAPRRQGAALRLDYQGQGEGAAHLEPLHTRGDGRGKGQWQAAQGLQVQAAGDIACARRHMRRALSLAEASGSPVRCARRLQHALELELQADTLAHSPDGHALLARAESSLQSHECAELRAVVERCEAAQALGAGRTDAALRALQRAIETTKLGRIQALSRLDAAWLLAEAVRTAEVPALVRPLGPWLDEHPLGRALSQRLAQSHLQSRQAAHRLPSLR